MARNYFSFHSGIQYSYDHFFNTNELSPKTVKKIVSIKFLPLKKSKFFFLLLSISLESSYKRSSSANIFLFFF